MQGYTLRDIQLLELEALKELSLLCKKNNIKFFLRGGSVLGAIKYNGFIPWDDDMDIAVPRNDYEKLQILLKEEWSDKFWCANYKNGDEIHCYFPRIMVKEDIIIQNKLPKNNLLGLSVIDILPLDGTPDSFFGKKIYFLKINVLRALASVWTYDIKETINMKSAFKTRIVKILYSLKVYKLYTQNQIYDKLNKIYSKHNWEDSKFSGTVTGSLYSKEIFPTEWWGSGQKVKFEDTFFFVPYEYDRYLKQLYGNDYMTSLPPIDKRKSHLIKK